MGGAGDAPVSAGGRANPSPAVAAFHRDGVELLRLSRRAVLRADGPVELTLLIVALWLRSPDEEGRRIANSNARMDSTLAPLKTKRARKEHPWRPLPNERILAAGSYSNDGTLWWMCSVAVSGIGSLSRWLSNVGRHSPRPDDKSRSAHAPYIDRTILTLAPSACAER